MPGHAIVKPHAAGNQQIGLLNRVIHPRLAVHAHHAQVQRMRGGEAAQPQQRQRHRNLRALGQSADLLHRARFNHAMAGQNHRPLGVANQLRSLCQPGVFHAAAWGAGDAAAAWLLQSQRSPCLAARLS